MEFIKRFFIAPTETFFLLGPRGTGKSTLIRKRYPDALWIDLLQPETIRNYLAKPERLQEIVTANPTKSMIVIDEIQLAPALLPVVHSLIEEKRNLQFILTGSSARKLKRTGADLLGGRALKRVLHPFMAAELQAHFSLEQALHTGLLPLIYEKADPLDNLNAYIHLYMQEEIYAEGLVRNIEHFSRFLETITFSHASLLNITNIARECAVKRKTIENYLNILEELMLAFHLENFTKKAKRELSAHPKFYLFDTGVFYALRPKGPFDKTEEIAGLALEGIVAQHLVAWADYKNDGTKIYFWRTRAGLEVDFVIYGPQGIWAIEVKNSRKISQGDTRSLQEFLKDYPIAKAILLYRGLERIQQDNVLCLPCEDFLRGLNLASFPE